MPPLFWNLRIGRGLSRTACPSTLGSQQHNVEAWDRALASAAAVFRACAERGIALAIVNLGGGFPARYVRKTPKLESYGKAILRSLRKHFGNNPAEHHRRAGPRPVGNAAIIEAEVVLIAKRSPEDEVRWVDILDIGKFHGLAETIGEVRPAIRSAPPRIATKPRPASAPSPARPATASTCSTRRRRTRCRCPPAIGYKVLIEAAGAYTASPSLARSSTATRRCGSM